jgi:hypothetical protein
VFLLSVARPRARRRGGGCELFPSSPLVNWEVAAEPGGDPVGSVGGAGGRPVRPVAGRVAVWAVFGRESRHAPDPDLEG